MMLILISFWGLSTYQRDAFRKAYGLSEQVDLFNSNSTQVFNRLTRSSQEEIRRQIKENPEQFGKSGFSGEFKPGTENEICLSDRQEGWRDHLLRD